MKKPPSGGFVFQQSGIGLVCLVRLVRLVRLVCGVIAARKINCEMQQ